MYVACRQLKISVAGEDGKTQVKTIQPGEPVPGADGWPYPNLIAHLNLQLIAWKGKTQVDAPHNAHRSAKGVVIPLIFRQMAPKKPTQDAAASSPDQPTQKAPAVVATPPSESLSCAECNGRTFKTSSALSTHTKHKHPKETKQSKAG